MELDAALYGTEADDGALAVVAGWYAVAGDSGGDMSEQGARRLLRRFKVVGQQGICDTQLSGDSLFSGMMDSGVPASNAVLRVVLPAATARGGGGSAAKALRAASRS